MAGNASVQLLAKGVLLLVSMTTFSLLTRYLGPEQYGRYNIILNVYGMAGVVAELGLGTIAIREIASGREGVGKILPALLAVRLTLGGLGVLAAVGIGGALGYDSELIRLIALYSLIFIVRGLGSGTYGLFSAAALQAWKNVIADVAESLLFVAIVMLGIANHRGIGWFVLGAIASAILSSLVVICLVRKRGPFAWRMDGRYCLRLVVEAVPVGIAGLFGVLYFRIDALMLSKLSGASAVGIYGAAYKYVESSSLIGTILLSSIFPVLAYCFEQDRTRFESYYGYALEWAAAFAVSLALSIYVFADMLVSLLNGAAFTGTALVLRICCGAIVLMFVNNIGAHLLYAARQQKQMVWINLIAAGAKVAVNFFVIPRYGAAGAAVATVLTEMLIGASVFAVVHYLQRLPTPILLLGKLGLAGLVIVLLFEIFHPDLAQRAMLMAGWVGLLLLIGIPKPHQVLKLLQGARGS